MSKPNLTATANGDGPGAHPNEAAIAKRAYEISLQRGSAPGHEIDDWLQAEAELLAAQATPETTPAEARAASPPVAVPGRPAPDLPPRRDRERNGGRRTQRQPHSH
jgi:hypothetical protein